MASNETVLLEPFGAKPGTKWFRTAFKWNRNQIFEWLKTTADAGGAGPNNKVPVALLTDIYNRLISLSLPNGTLYQNPRLRPRSHIARKVDENWDPYNPETSKFAVKGWAIRPSIQASRAPVPEWWCPYDLLGLFLSLLGPAPATATKNNFYLPLTAVYGRWCSRIAGHPDYGWWTPTIQGEGNFPYVFQCTWHLEVDRNTKQHWRHYFLGASTGGDRWKSTRDPERPPPATYTGKWRERVQEARFMILLRCQQIVMVKENDFRDKNAPSQKLPKGTKVPFGNCAETYPFAIRFSGKESQNKASMSGLALQKHFMKDEEYGEYDEFLKGNIWDNLVAPCVNCKMLISNAGANNSQFSAALGEEDATEKPESVPGAEKLLVENGSSRREPSHALTEVSLLEPMLLA